MKRYIVCGYEPNTGLWVTQAFTTYDDAKKIFDAHIQLLMNDGLYVVVEGQMASTNGLTSEGKPVFGRDWEEFEIKEIEI